LVVVRSELAIGESIPVNIPKLWNRCGEFEMSAETLEAGLVGQALTDKVEIFFHGLALRVSEINLSALSTFFTTNLNVHNSPQPL
jgi:hypothetical protein